MAAKVKAGTKAKFKAGRKAGSGARAAHASGVSRAAGTRTSQGNGQPQDLLSRLASGAVICAEGYVFELERRGYLQAGSFVPEVVLEHPEAVEQLYREVGRAGSDGVE